MTYHKIRWTVEKITQQLAFIETWVYRRQVELPAFRLCELEGPALPAPVGVEVDDTGWARVEAGQFWGRRGLDFVLRTHFRVPADWGAPAALYLPLGETGDFSHPEALAYIDGRPYAACDRHHQEILLPAEWMDGAERLLALHGWTGTTALREGASPIQLYLRPCQVVQIHSAARTFTALARVALGTAQSLADEVPTRPRLLNALEAAFKRLDLRSQEGFYASLPAAQQALEEGIAQAGGPLEVRLYAAGHAHIDVAWLWTLGQTHRKAERTFHTVLRLMEQFPAYRFTQSQPQLYEFIRQDQPELFAAIQQRAAEGRWELTGGMWVEADCNLSGAEALARQFLLGRGYFRRYFGAGRDTPVLWLPDVFGYAWALPQLIQQAGLKYFMTIKIGWSQYNRLPYDTFWWQGLDGTRILTHFSTAPDPGSYASTYNALATPGEALGAWRNFQQKELHGDLLMAYGYGDGGGGPTRQMLENIEVMGNFPGLPQVQPAFVGDFFKQLETTIDERTPVWNGELYLEYHRGTYTTQSRNKRANRKAEFLLHDAEFLAAYASLLDPTYTYPAEALNTAWQTVCLNQFHDIIPGSSIGEVYTESLAQYAEARGSAEAICREALESLASKCGGGLVVANPTAFRRSEVVFLPGELNGAPVWEGRALAVQEVEGGVLIDLPEMAPYSVRGVGLAAGDAPGQRKGGAGTSPARTEWSASKSELENQFLRVEIDAAGDITRIYDKSNQRDVLPPGAVANQFQAFEDRPKFWDAWDIEIYYDDKLWLAEPAESMRVVESGPLRASLEIRRRILNSVYVQRISLAHNSPRLDFNTTIDWQERHILLKTAFPVQVLSPVASYEIQWGNVQRPTHRNTSWDWARFETCAHKWVDLSEGGYGVSLLNDCKYGHDIHDNVMRISLLRGTTMPDPQADLGEHRFAYSLLPHAGSWDENTMAAAYALNDPLRVYLPETASQAAPAVKPHSLIACDAPNVVIETVKRAEDGNGLIVRLYEAQRRRGPVRLQAGFPLKEAWQANLLEENEERLEVEQGGIRLELRPYQIATLRLVNR